MRFLHKSAISPKAVIAEFLFVQNYIEGLWMHTWSLAVEEHFYLLLPLLLLILWKRQPTAPNPFRKLPAIFVVLASATLILRVALARITPFSLRVSDFPTHLRLDSLFFGVLLSYFSHYKLIDIPRLSKRFFLPLTIAGLALFAPAFVWDKEDTRWLTTYGFTLLYLGSGCLLIGSQILDTRPRGRFLEALGAIGSHSYSIYLWHAAVIFWLIPMLQSLLHTQFSYPITIILYLTGAILVGMALSLVWEDPILKFRNKLFPSESGNPATNQ
jgi:peptidoglycan/LPS O-acetylase OafA/YrhL